MPQLFDNRTGKLANPRTDFEYFKQDNLLMFNFVAYESSLSSYSNKDNDTLYKGDVVEVFLDIGIDGYYELEVAPNGATFIAKIVNEQIKFIKNYFFRRIVEHI